MVRIAGLYDSPLESARAIVGESYKRWIDGEEQSDDITAIVIFLENPLGMKRASMSMKRASMRNSRISTDLRVSRFKDLDLEDLEFGTIDEAEEREQKEEEAGPIHLDLGFSAKFWTLFAGFCSGYLGGLCGIRGPPIILYFLHPPYPVSFGTLFLDGEDYFTADDWPLYVVIFILSNVGVLLGSYLFVIIKDSQKTIKAILSIFLALSGLSLLISAFGNI
jgi:hypothetical protein